MVQVIHNAWLGGAVIGAQMDNWDVVFAVVTAVMVSTIFLLIHLAVSHRRGGKDG
jgi:hypothetical protein